MPPPEIQPGRRSAPATTNARKPPPRRPAPPPRTPRSPAWTRRRLRRRARRRTSPSLSTYRRRREGKDARRRRRHRRVQGRGRSIVPETKKRYNYSAQIIPRLASKWPKPPWHAPRKPTGHLRPPGLGSQRHGGSLQSGSRPDPRRTIKIWTSPPQLKLTRRVTSSRYGPAVSLQHPYMFSCGPTRYRCWDLEQPVIRHYHGHLSGVYSLALHPARTC